MWNLDGKHLFWQLAILLVAPKYPDQTIFVGGGLGDSRANEKFLIRSPLDHKHWGKDGEIQHTNAKHKACSKSSSYVIGIIPQLSTLRKKESYGPTIADNSQIIHVWLWHKCTCMCTHTFPLLNSCLSHFLCLRRSATIICLTMATRPLWPSVNVTSSLKPSLSFPGRQSLSLSFLCFHMSSRLIHDVAWARISFPFKTE